jgi:hypothetical protein
VVAPTVESSAPQECAGDAGDGTDGAWEKAKEIGGVAGGGGDGRSEVFRAKFLLASAA